MQSPFTLLARLINGYPKVVAGLLLVVLVVSLYGTTLISMETGTSGYLDESSAFGQNYAEYTSTFSADTLILLIETSDPTGIDQTPVHGFARRGSAPAAARHSRSPRSPTWSNRRTEGQCRPRRPR